MLFASDFCVTTNVFCFLLKSSYSSKKTTLIRDDLDLGLRYQLLVLSLRVIRAIDILLQLPLCLLLIANC